VRALHRNADIDAQHISVTVKDDAVTLKGTITSWTNATRWSGLPAALPA
jgi:osmotically-inducible protein OsmY